MRITKVDIPKSESDSDGLEHIKMDKLGEVVLITGKNGSGKTRILKKIFNAYQSKPHQKEIENAKLSVTSYQRQIQGYIETLSKYKDSLPLAPNQSEVDILKKHISRIDNEIFMTRREISTLEEIAFWDKIETDKPDKNSISVPFVPKDLNLIDCNTFSKAKLISLSDQPESVGVMNLAKTSFAKIQVTQDRWFNATHQNSQVSETEKNNAIVDYNNLNNLIHIFLNTTLGRTLDGIPTLFGFSMGGANLSDGQKVLLQFCMAIYSQGSNLNNLILILDEPENHLHPSVIIETLDRIQKCNLNGQIWIATHSIPLLAHFDPSLIWYVENNKISYAGKIPEKVLNSLLGDENEIGRLQDFTSLPAQFATSRYAFECLIEPKVVMTDSDDPQSYQVRTELLKISKEGKLRILDFGAGQGRLISNIFDLDLVNGSKLIDSLDYIAYDKYDIEKEHCESCIKRAYGNSNKRYFNNPLDILSVYDKKSFDVILMCNVFHEIDPKDWLKLFSIDSLIISLLNDNGFLLLVEDHQMPIGERAYQKGFLVLDTPQLKDLFVISEKEKEFIVSDARGDGRLKAHRIPKRCLLRINEETRIEALQSLSIIAQEKILEIREKEKNYQNGKLHGFWTQLFANAQLAVAELKKD